MSALLRAELLKLRTTRTFAALVGSAAALSLLVVCLATALSDNVTEADLRDFFTADFTALFILLLGVMGMAGEWRHRTITSTILAAPDRTRLVAAKLLAYVIAGALMSLVVTLTIMAVGSAILSARDEATLGIGELADVLWRNLAVAGFSAAIGVCVGGLVRNQVAAIVGLLVFSFALEPTLLALAPDVGKFGPTSGAPVGIQGTGFDDDEDVLDTGAAALVLLGWVAAGAVATALTLKRRDVL